MMMISTHFPHSPPPLSIFSSSSRPKLSVSSSVMDMQHNQGIHNKFMEFPFVSAPHKNLMVGLASTMEDHLHSHLLPCTLPPDVRHYQSQSGAAQAALRIRSGQSDSPIDFILGSWVHSELPTGGSVDITSLAGYLKSTNDTPNFVFDMIRSSPTMVILILDLPPRKDLVLWPNDLKTFYEDTQLDTQKQALEKLPEVQPYSSSSLFYRTFSSPTAISVRIQTENYGGEERMEEVIRNHLYPVSKQVLETWLGHCTCAKREIAEEEKAYLKKRDGIIRKKAIEIDLGSKFPKLFGQEVANRVLEVINEYFIV